VTRIDAQALSGPPIRRKYTCQRVKTNEYICQISSELVLTLIECMELESNGTYAKCQHVLSTLASCSLVEATICRRQGKAQFSVRSKTIHERRIR
jgi:hypothetical protein